MTENVMNDDWIEEEHAFAKALETRKEQNKEAEKPAYTYIANNNRDEVPWYGLENGVDTVVRLLGVPAESRTENWHAKVIFYSELVTDNKKRYSDIIWKTEKNYDGKCLGVVDTDWVLYKVFNTTFTKKWENIPFIDDKGKSRNGRYVYDYENTDIYKILYNNELSLNKDIKLFPKKVKPQKRVILPVLVRNENSAQVRILTTKHSAKEYTDRQGNQRLQVYCDFGIPAAVKGEKTPDGQEKQYLYDFLMARVVDRYGTWNFDVVLKKTKLTETNTHYDVYPCFSTEVSSFAKSLVSQVPELKTLQRVNKEGKIEDYLRPKPIKLTPQEEALEKPNIDLLFAETSYEKLHLFHKELFILADKTFKTNFYDELVENFKLENPKASSNISATTVTLPVTETYNQSSLPTQQVQEAPVSRRGIIDQAGSDLVSQCRQVFKSWDKLLEKEQTLILETLEGFNNGIPKYKQSRGREILQCACQNTFVDTSTGLPSEVKISCHQDVVTCPMCAESLL